MDIILATRNPSKAEQINALFKETRFNVLSMSAAGIEGEAVEDGTTLAENAGKKARYVHERMKSPAWVVADDTGLFVAALNGEPGIQAAYWGGRELSTEERMRYCLAQLEGQSNRRATFRVCVVAISPGGKEHQFLGEVAGSLHEAPRVAPRKSMPYSALFVPEGSAKAWAEMTVAEENALSHRGKAFRKLVQFFENL